MAKISITARVKLGTAKDNEISQSTLLATLGKNDALLRDAAFLMQDTTTFSPGNAL